MLKRQEDGLAAYEGYCIDLLNELAKTLHFTYNIKPSPDGFFGVETINGSWNGMIGELLNKVRNKKQTLPDRGARQVPHFSYRNFPWALKDAWRHHSFIKTEIEVQRMILEIQKIKRWGI